MKRNGSKPVGASLLSLVLLSLVFLSCAPPALFMEPVHPTRGDDVYPEYRDLSLEDLEALFVRPFTGRTLMETSGTTSALLYDYAYLMKRAGGKSGGAQALRAMRERFLEQGVSFRVVIWGNKPAEVDLERWSFRLVDGEGGAFHPSSVQEVQGAEMQEASIRGEATWRSVAEITFPFRLDSTVSHIVLEAYRDGVKVQQHTWKFDWR